MTVQADGGTGVTVASETTGFASDDVGDFDIEAARAESARILSGADAPSDDPPAPEADDSTPQLAPEAEADADEEPEEKPEPKAAKEEEEEPENETDEEHAKRRRQKLQSKEGKLDEDKLERAFAKLTSQERRLKQQRTEFQSERSQWEQRVQIAESKVKEYDERKTALETEWNERREKAKREPLTALQELGWTLEQLTQYVANEGKIPPEKLLKDMEDGHKKRLEELENKQKELQESIRAQQVRAQALSYQQKVFDEVSDEYKSLKYVAKKHTLEQLQPLVRDHLVKTYRETGKALDPRTVLRQYEASIIEDLKRLGIDAEQTSAASEQKQTSGAGKPPKPLTNGAAAERTRVASISDDDDDEPFDRDAAWRESMRRLNS